MTGRPDPPPAGALVVRPFRAEDEAGVIDLWQRAGMVVPANNPREDIRRKLETQPELFLVGLLGERLAATCLAGYEGHRGWINYLAVDPDLRRLGLGRRIMAEAEKRLLAKGCPKINLQVRETNLEVIDFYRALGYETDRVVSLGKRLIKDPPFPG